MACCKTCLGRSCLHDCIPRCLASTPSPLPHSIHWRNLMGVCRHQPTADMERCGPFRRVGCTQKRTDCRQSTSSVLTCESHVMFSGEDPTANRLQRYAAEVTGKEAALFVPTGTMANLIAVLAQCGRGGEVCEPSLLCLTRIIMCITLVQVHLGSVMNTPADACL